MEYRVIEEIMNRYLEGKSTLEEETLLREYFSQPGLPAEQLEMKELFSYFAEEHRQAAPSFDVSADLNSLIENEWKRETRSRFRRVSAWVGSAAALLVLSLGIYQYIDKPEPPVKDTFKDPKLAYIETKRVLLMVSRSMNHNTTNLKYLAKVDESFGHLKRVAEIDKIVNSVKNK